MCEVEPTYRAARSSLLTAMGYTARKAGLTFYDMSPGDIKGMDADALVERGKSLYKRMHATVRVPEDVLFHSLLWWVYRLVPRKARVMIDSRRVTSLEELTIVLRDYVAMEGSFREFSRPLVQSSEISGPSKPKLDGKGVVCYTCNTPGHKSPDCLSKDREKPYKQARPGGELDRVSGGTISCYTCHEKGHKSFQCPYKKNVVRKVKKEPEPKPIKKVWNHAKKEHVLEGSVNGSRINLLLDSGAGITIVPRSRVPEADIREREIELIRPYGAKTPFHWPTAQVHFEVGNIQWDERVVVVPHDPEDDSEVIYALDLGSNFHGELLQLYYTQEEAKRVNTVRTCSMARAEEAEGKIDAAEIAVEKPKVTSIADPVRSEVGVEEPVSETGGAGEESEPILGDDGEELMFGGLVDGLEPSVAGEEEYAVRGEASGTEAGIDLPIVATRGDRAKLVKRLRMIQPLQQ